MGGGRWSSFCNPTKTRKELAKERSCSTKNWYVSYFNDVMRFLHHCMRLKTKVFRYLWRTYLFRDSKLSNLKKNINKHAVKRLHFIQFLIIPHWSKCQANSSTITLLAEFFCVLGLVIMAHPPPPCGRFMKLKIISLNPMWKLVKKDFDLN